MFAIIGGTGFYKLGKRVEELDVLTHYGTARLSVVSFAGEKIVFIPRHGEKHELPPHKINYRANIAALKKIDVRGVISVYSAGVISKYKPGDMVMLDDFIGLWTPITFHEDFFGGMKHADFSSPFSKELGEKIQEVSSVGKLGLKKGGIIATTPGPRFETKSEVKMLRKMGANLVNMTAAYEMSLLGEAEIDFAAIAVASNYAAGISKKPLKAEETLQVMAKAKTKVENLISGVLEEINYSEPLK
ncbi:MTAP family purine nucleoside phosphorylase [Candidatus Micrarchaeota archaeon]|nr:MTAP family purine nucleoside phosphorylase [Candidatus Micrarchaeota archaeon]